MSTDSGFFNHPLFIVSNSRAGSTALKLALSIHPQIITRAGEAPLVSDIGYMAYLLEHHKDASYFRRDLRISTDVVKSKLRQLCIETIFGRMGGAYFLLKAFLRRPLLTKKIIWCNKTFPNHKEYLGILELFPQAKFIFIIRNGIDQVASTINCWPGSPFEQYCIQWRDQFSKYAYAWNNPNFLMVRHEVLVKSPELIMKDIFEFCNVVNNEKPSLYLKSRKVNVKQQTKDDSITSYLANKQPRFINWSEDEKNTFKKICGPKMEEFSYSIPF